MERFVAERLLKSTAKGNGASAPAMRFAYIGIIVAVVIMILTISVTRAFKAEITDKITAFTGHWTITNPRQTDLSGSMPIAFDSELQSLLERPYIDKVQRYAQHPAILGKDSCFNGILLKGIAQEYNTEFLQSCMVNGVLPNFTDSAASGEIVISQALSALMDIGSGDKISVFIIDRHVSVRRLTVAGIYNSGFESFDNTYCFTDLNTVQRINAWEPNQISGIEIYANNRATFSNYISTAMELDNLGNRNNSVYYISTQQETYSDIFAWLDVLNVNVIVILVLVIAIAGFTMTSGLLIIIFEKAHTIGLLKALGASDRTIRNLFMQMFGRLALKGIVVGNIIGISIALIQHWFHIVKLNPVTYYLDAVPAQIEPGWLLALDAGTVIIMLLIIMLPAWFTKKITPVSLLRTE
ncbi:MAG: ABC transporter permease [Bacteroidaceae bacterium]|nr:ABC transporter permease [Bacteroidaceae bacterium]